MKFAQSNEKQLTICCIEIQCYSNSVAVVLKELQWCKRLEKSRLT